MKIFALTIYGSRTKLGDNFVQLLFYFLYSLLVRILWRGYVYHVEPLGLRTSGANLSMDF
jgi:hypothetical protein